MSDEKAVTVPPSSSESSPTSAGNGAASWTALGTQAIIALAVSLILIGVIAVMHLPPGVGFSDAGDLQTGSAMLGIMHPPGYAPLTTLGFLLTRLPWVDPAYLVSLGCLASGLIALGLCLLLQVRLGVHPWLAGALTMLLAIHPRTWRNLVDPEVYAPTMAFLAGGVYLLVRFAHRGFRRDLLLGAFLLGVALANRPLLIWISPFFVIAWWVGRPEAVRGIRKSVAPFCLATACAALPGIYSLGYLWVRDAPTTTYNYIEMHNAESRALPPATDGWRAKAQRIWFHVSAKEFHPYLTQDWRQARLRVRWLMHEFFLPRQVELAGAKFFVGRFQLWPTLALLGTGAFLAWRRCRASCWLLLGLGVSNVVFVCIYRIIGLAADLSPLMFAAVVLFGAAITPVFNVLRRRYQTGMGVLLFAAVGVLAILDAPHRFRPDNALPFLEQVDMATLPPDSVICSGWFHSTPLWYAQHVVTKRGDIEIINTWPHHWLKRIREYPGRPVFFIQQPSDAEGYTITRYRNLWRLER